MEHVKTLFTYCYISVIIELKQSKTASVFSFLFRNTPYQYDISNKLYFQIPLSPLLKYEWRKAAISEKSKVKR